MKKYALILGAKSDVAKALAHALAKDGWNLYLAGRNAETEIIDDAKDLAIRHKVTATAAEFDAGAIASHETFWKQLDPKPELVVSVVGYMPEQEDSEKDPMLMQKVMDANFTGLASILGIAANDFEKQKSGGIIGISSVAGDRGRAKNYIYGSAKAGFTAFLSGLRNRLAFAGVHVMTVKPGFIYTKMTEGLDLPPKLTAKPEEVANDILKAWKKKKNTIYTKWMWKHVMRIIRNIPEWKFKKMKL